MAADDKYVSLGGLTHYDEKIKEYAKDHCAVLEDANWQKTGISGAVSFLPAPEMQLDPVVNFKFTETGPASGTKGPDNPSTIAGVSEVKVTRCGKNLLKYYTTSGTEINGITWTVKPDGTVVANGTATATAVFYANAPYWSAPSRKLTLQPGVYSLKAGPSDAAWNKYGMQAIWATGGEHTSTGDIVNGYVITVTEPSVFTLQINIWPGITVSNVEFKPQLELLDTPTDYELYSGNDYVISLNGTYYGGSVDLSTGIMTVTWRGMVLDGTESWFGASTHGTYYRYAIGNLPSVDNYKLRYCTHYPLVGSFSYEEQHFLPQGTYLYFFTTQTTLEEWESWLATQYANNTPVIVVYSLVNPYTVQLTPTQIKTLPALSKYEPRTNTVYSDQESVQVGYPKSPIATDNELTNAIISLGGNV